MITSGYTLDLYCDNKKVKHAYYEFPHTFFGEHGSTCRADARRAGWKLDLRNGTAICPTCNGKRKK